MLSEKVIEELRSYVILTLMLAITSIGWGCFVIPANIVGGGVMGLSTLLYLSTGIPVGLSNFVTNAILILIAMKVIGASFGFKTIYCLIVLSLMVQFMQMMVPEPWVEDKFMCAIIGGVIIGSSIGIMLTQGGSTGGTEIVAMIVTKYRNVMPGRVMMLLDVVIIGISYLHFHDIESIMYGYVVMIGMSVCADYMLTGSKQSVQIMVVSKRGREVADSISATLMRGITLINGKGYYTGQEREIIMMIVRRNEMHLVLKAIERTDKEAFISVATVMGVYGNGFEVYKPPISSSNLINGKPSTIKKQE